LTARLPAKIEVSALLRLVQAEGGFGAIIARGDPDAGTVMVVLCDRGGGYRAFERMPSADGGRNWQCTRRYNAESPDQFPDWLKKRADQDKDLWIVELDIADGERFIGLTGDD